MNARVGNGPVMEVEVVPHISNIINEWNMAQLSDKQYRLHHFFQLDPHKFWLQAVRNSGKLDWLITSGGRKNAAGASWGKLYSNKPENKPLRM